MKNSSLSTLDQPKSRHPRGFALVATLLLMVLLSLLAIGMLSLSTVTIRSSSRLDSMAEARANAKMALMIAIGELQKELGPDKRISATSEILGTDSAPVNKPNMVGVWDSWDLDPTNSPNYAAEKTNRFRRWLVSSPENAATQERDFVNDTWSETGQTIETVELVGAKTLGTDPASVSPEDTVIAGLVPVSQGGRVRGSYAWHVSDESVKARINLYRDPSQNSTLAQKRALLAGHRPDPSVIKGPDGNLALVTAGGDSILPTDHTQEEFDLALTSVGKVIDLNQAELLPNALDKIKPLRNDITPYSLGVITNVRNGGLKQDLSSVFEMGSTNSNAVPLEFDGQKLYDSTHGITGVSDPKWSALAGYYNSYRNLANPETNPTLVAKSGSDGSGTVPAVPDSYNPAPVITKIDTVFSLIGRPLEDVDWMVGEPDPNKPPTQQQLNNRPWLYHDYFVNLIFTPVITLHNPYNVSISFHKMKLEFQNIPVAFNFMHKSGDGGDFVSMSVDDEVFEPINTMRWSGDRADKAFTITIANWPSSGSGSEPSDPIVLKPGQTLVCSPSLSPTASFYKDASFNGANGDAYDWNNTATSDIKAAPGYLTGLGYEISGVAISALRGRPYLNSRPNRPVFMPSNNQYPGTWAGQPYLMLRDVTKPLPADDIDVVSGLPRVSGSVVSDEFYVEFKIQRPAWYTTDSTSNQTDAAALFEVTAKLQATSSGSLEEISNFEFTYQDDDTLKDVFNDQVYRYPPDYALKGSDIDARHQLPYGEQSSVAHPFAIFSASARTTRGGVYRDDTRTPPEDIDPDEMDQDKLLRDGALAGKPFLFHNPTLKSFTLNLANEKPGIQAYELNLQPFLSPGDHEDYMDVDVENRVPSLSGNKSDYGIKSGSYFAIPSGPLQTIADFRRSNALTTAYLPHFVQPVGNSLLHPLMSPSNVVETDTSVSPDPLLDHSFLANHALFDRFYFSTFASKGILTPDTVFEQFMNRTAPLASQAFQPYLPIGKTEADAKSNVFVRGKPRDTAYQHAAEYQMISSPFNVNSTSVQAWKAVLASMNKSEITTLWAKSGELESTTTTGIPITAMSLLNGGASGSTTVDGGDIDDERTNNWNGYRELTESELNNLATKIVEEVQKRGPFLSMSEFVNRQIGPVGPLTLSGALDAAIAASEINEPLGASSDESFLNQVPITTADVNDTTLYDYNTPEATTGNPAAGAPGWVNQADLLRILEPSATVRGDTFVIRVYGEARDATGVTARAYAEAVVQRISEYVDPANRPSLNVYSDPTATAANQVFGRRMNLVSFRWLSENEI